MALTIKHHPLKRFPMVIALTAVAFFFPVIHFSPASIWSKGTVFASNTVSLPSDDTSTCHDGNADYRYVQITNGTSSSSVANIGSYNLYFDASELVREHRRARITLRAHTSICWEGGLIYGNNAANRTTNIRRENRRHVPAMRIVGYHRDAEIEIHRVGFFDIHDALEIRGEMSTITISDSRFRDVNSCIVGSVDGNLIIESSLIEGCHIPVQSYLSETDLSGRVRTLRNNAIRVDHKPIGLTATSRIVGDGLSSKPKPWIVEVHGNVFLVENDNAKVRLQDWLSENVSGCSNNVVVWLGGEDSLLDLPECFSVTNDINVWEETRHSWIQDHEIVEPHEQSLQELDQIGESLDVGEAEEPGDNARVFLRSGSSRDAELAGLGDSEVRSLSIEGFGTQGGTGLPWADRTRWSDGTGWKDG